MNDKKLRNPNASRSGPAAYESAMDLRATSSDSVTSSGVVPRIPDPHELNVGTRVQRSHPWDGSRRSGLPIGPELTVVKFYNYGDQSLVELSDGSHAFAWTLVPVKSNSTAPASAKLA